MKDSKGPYKKGSFEFVAAYVIPENVWFIIPEKKVRGKWSVGLYPKLERSKYWEVQGAWNLLRGKLPEVIDGIEACAEEVERSSAQRTRLRMTKVRAGRRRGRRRRGRRRCRGGLGDDGFAGVAVLGMGGGAGFFSRRIVRRR